MAVQSRTVSLRRKAFLEMCDDVSSEGDQLNINNIINDLQVLGIEDVAIADILEKVWEKLGWVIAD